MRRKTSSSSTSASRMSIRSRISVRRLYRSVTLSAAPRSWQTRRTAKSSSTAKLAYAARRPRWPSSRLDSQMFRPSPAAFWLGRKRSIRRCQSPDDNQRRCNKSAPSGPFCCAPAGNRRSQSRSRPLVYTRLGLTTFIEATSFSGETSDMSLLRINDEAPDFTADTTHGPIQFHQWIGDNWAVLFSHPKDFTPVCTTELGAMAGLEGEFAKRGAKIIGLSVDPVENHARWAVDIRDVTGNAVNTP